MGAINIWEKEQFRELWRAYVSAKGEAELAYIVFTHAEEAKNAAGVGADTAEARLSQAWTRLSEFIQHDED